MRMKHDLACTLVGVSSLVSNAAKSLVQAWTHHLQSSDTSTDPGCSDESESDLGSVISSDEDALLPWDDWETFVQELGQPGEQSFYCTLQTVSLPQIQ